MFRRSELTTSSPKGTQVHPIRLEPPRRQRRWRRSPGRPRECAAKHDARPTAGVEPAPHSGPPGVRQGASGAGPAAGA